jgi:hypothetical protein
MSMKRLRTTREVDRPLHTLEEGILLLRGRITVLHAVHGVGSVNLDGTNQVLFVPSHAESLVAMA